MTNVLLRRVRLGPQRPIQDLVISGGRVSVVSEREAGDDPTDVIDLAGRFVLPGLWDRHVHFDQWAQVSARLDLSSAGSATAAARVVARHVAGREMSADTAVVGYGFRDALWADPPQREVLDAACAAVPVVLISGDLHSAWLNTAALRRYGHADNATGLLREEAAMQVIGEVGRVPDDVVDSWCLAASRAAAARGIVGIVDMERPWSLDAWRRRIAGGNRSLRVVSCRLVGAACGRDRAATPHR